MQTGDCPNNPGKSPVFIISFLSYYQISNGIDIVNDFPKEESLESMHQ